MTTKRGRGRPAKAKGRKQSAVVATYLTPAEGKRLRADAKRQGMTPSAFLAGLWREWRESRED